MKLNEKIYLCRRKAGLSQEALAEKAGVSRQAVSKWETGTAMPELDKIAVLSEIFGVTTDWLIKDNSEDEGTSENADEDHEHSADEMAGFAENARTDNTPPRSYTRQFEEGSGFLARQIRRYGWLTGVYVAVSGGGLALLGVIVKVIVNAMMSGFSRATDSMMNSFGGFGSQSPEIIIEGDIPDEVLAQIQNEIAGSYGGGMFDSFQSSSDAMMDAFASYNPVSIAGNIMIVIGVIGIIAGVILAVWLKGKGNTAD